MVSFKNMEGTDFEGAGSEAGVVMWRIIKRHLVKIEGNDPIFSGKLYEKDAVLLLETEVHGTDYHWYVRTWTGKSAGMVLAGFTGSMANKLGNLLSSNGSVRDLEIGHEKQGSESIGFKQCLGDSIELSYEAGEAPVKKKSATTSSASETAPAKLYELYDGAVKRVAMNTTLATDKAYLLDCPQENIARSWAGRKVMRVQRAVSEELARRIVKYQYSSEEARAEHYRQDEDDADFLAALKRIGLTPESLSNKTPTHEIRVLDLDQKVLLGSHEQSLPCELLKGVVFVDCFGTESYVWAHKGATAQEIGKIPESAQLVKERFEPVVFKERFFGWPDTELEIGNTMKRRDEAAKATKKKMISVDARIRILLGLDAGLAHEAEEDPQPIAAASDPSLDLKVYHIKEEHHLDINRPPICSLEEGYRSSDSAKFHADTMYIIRITWNQGRRHVIYTWEGNSASTQSRSTAGIEVPVIAKSLQGIEHQIYIKQNAEPPLLLASIPDFASLYTDDLVEKIYECRDDVLFQFGPNVFEKIYKSMLDPYASYVIQKNGSTQLVHGPNASDSAKKRAEHFAGTAGTTSSPSYIFASDLLKPGNITAFTVSNSRRVVGSSSFIEELPVPLSQADLTGCIVVVTDCVLYLWYSGLTNDDDLKLGCDFAARYEKTSRKSTQLKIELVAAGAETVSFVRLFRGWRIAENNEIPKKSFLQKFLSDCIATAEAGRSSPLDIEPVVDDAASTAPGTPVGGVKIPLPSTGSKRTLGKHKAGREVTIEERMGPKVERAKDGALIVKAGQAFRFDEEECHIQDILTEMHHGTSDYCVYGYHGKKIVHIVDHGTGGLAALKSKLETTNVNYGLLALTPEVLTAHYGREVSHPIYILIVWIPATGVSPLVKGAVNSHRSAVAQIFEPVHETITAEALDGLEDDKIWSLVTPHLH